MGRDPLVGTFDLVPEGTIGARDAYPLLERGGQWRHPCVRPFAMKKLVLPALLLALTFGFFGQMVAEAG